MPSQMVAAYASPRAPPKSRWLMLVCEHDRPAKPAGGLVRHGKWDPDGGEKDLVLMDDLTGDKVLEIVPEGTTVFEDEDFVYVVIDPNGNLDLAQLHQWINTEGQSWGVEFVGTKSPR